MGRNRALGTPYQVEVVTEDFTTTFGVDAYMVDAVPLVVTLDPYAVNGDQVLIQDITDSAAAEPIVISASDGQTILNGYGASISIASNGGSVLLTMTEDGWVPQAGGASAAPSHNRGWIQKAAPANNQGSGGAGSGYIALIQAVARGSGIFRWSVAMSAFTQAADNVLFYVETQFGTGAFGTTGGAAPAGSTPPPNGVALVSNGASGTLINITQGAASPSRIATTDGMAMGTLETGAAYGASGIVSNAGAPFPVGSNVVLGLFFGTGATAANRAAAAINMSLEEI